MHTQFLDLYRASVRSASELMKTSLEQTERLQQQQLLLIRTAMEETTRSSSQVGEVKSLDDVLVLNSRLAGAHLERVAEFWSTWWRVAGDTQKSMIDQMQTQLGQAKDRMEDAARIATSQVSGVSAHDRKERKSA